MDDILVVSRDERDVVTVCLNRPHRYNALTTLLVKQLISVGKSLDHDPSIRIVILTGAGKAFCAGGDKSWIEDQVKNSNSERLQEARNLATMMQVWNTLSAPLIVAAPGPAIGAGLGLLCTGDVAFGTPKTTLGIPETRLGQTPSIVGPYVVNKMGIANARQLFMSSRLVDGQRGAELGLLSECVDRNVLDARVEQEVQAYLDCAPDAVREAKRQILALGAHVDDQTLENAIDSLSQRWGNAEAEKGIAALMAGKKPDWTA